MARMLGDWETELGRMTIIQSSGEYIAILPDPSAPQGHNRELARLNLRPSGDGATLTGGWSKGADVRGTASITFEPGPRRIIVRLAGGLNGRDHLIGTAGKNALWLERDYKDWFGTFETLAGPMTLRPEGQAIVGTLQRRASENHPAATMDVLFAPVPGFHGTDGIWEAPSASVDLRGTLKANVVGSVLGGTWTSNYWQPSDRIEWLAGEKAPKAPTDREAARWVGQWKVQYGQTRFVATIAEEGESYKMQWYRHDAGYISRGYPWQLAVAKTPDENGSHRGAMQSGSPTSVKAWIQGVNSIEADICDFENKCQRAYLSRLSPVSAAPAPQSDEPESAPPAQPQPQPSPAPGAEQGQDPVPAHQADFKSLGKYDVRVDRVVVARDAERIDVFVTLRNASTGPLYATSGALMVRLEDSDGVGKVNGQILRATPEGRAHFASTPVIEAGGELRAKYSFHPDPGASPERVVIMEGNLRAEFPSTAT